MVMRWLRRRGLRHRGQRPGTLGSAGSDDSRHLEEFASSRRGVEGFVEPRTTVTETTLVLVDIDGEWTRRRVPSADWAHDFANQHGIPSYDAAVVGYPARMREYNRRKSAERKRLDVPDDLSGL